MDTGCVNQTRRKHWMIEPLELGNRLVSKTIGQIVSDSIGPPAGLVEDRGCIPTKTPNLVQSPRRLPGMLRSWVEHTHFILHAAHGLPTSPRRWSIATRWRIMLITAGSGARAAFLSLGSHNPVGPNFQRFLESSLGSQMPRYRRQSRNTGWRDRKLAGLYWSSARRHQIEGR